MSALMEGQRVRLLDGSTGVFVGVSPIMGSAVIDLDFKYGLKRCERPLDQVCPLEARPRFGRIFKRTT